MYSRDEYIIKREGEARVLSNGHSDARRSFQKKPLVVLRVDKDTKREAVQFTTNRVPLHARHL